MSQLAIELRHDAINNQIDGNSNVSPKKLSFKKKVKDQLEQHFNNHQLLQT